MLPISAIKSANEARQRSQTVMPSPPSFLYEGSFWFSHRFIMWSHDSYSRLLLSPCVLILFFEISERRQPQLFVFPIIKQVAVVSFSLPQSQRHNHQYP